MTKYELPKKKFQTFIEINGQTIILKSSFAEKMDFATWIQKNQDKPNSWLMSEVIRKNLPKDLAEEVLDKGTLEMISEIFADIVSNKLGLTKEEYLAKTSEVVSKKK